MEPTVGPLSLVSTEQNVEIERSGSRGEKVENRILEAEPHEALAATNAPLTFPCLQGTFLHPPDALGEVCPRPRLIRLLNCWLGGAMATFLPETR